MRFALLLAAFVAAVRADNGGIKATTVQSLNGTWRLTDGASHNVPATVPGDLLTDLQLAGLIGDPLYETNFRGNVWDSGNWTYSLTFTAEDAASPSHFLVFDGIKMVADVYFNGAYLGFASDQFLRYSFNVTGLVSASSNNVTLVFPTSNDGRNSEERWMSCSGGWDWAPYSTTSYQGKCTTFSKGIWKGVALIGIAAGSAALEHVAPRAYYLGAYPTEPLADASHGDFQVNVSVHFLAPAATSGTLAVTGAWAGGSATVPVTLPAGRSAVTVTLPAADNAVSLWWPAQTPGAQTLYAVNVVFTPAGAAPVSDARRLGFRVFTMVTGNDTDPSTLAGKDGQDHFTMRFKVNGANIYSRGANMIPMEEMEGRSSDAAHRRLVQSAVEGGFNTFRLWGGGIFQWDAWYDACDEMGMLIYQDMMFAQGNHAPSVTPTQTDEILYQVRRLSHHPSVALWDGCNECDGHGIYADFVMTTIAAEDPSRPPWPSCPSGGWASGVDALWGLPNGSPQGLKPRPRGDPHADSLPTHADRPVRGTCAVQSAGAAAALGCSSGADNCSYVPGQDYDQGTNGPNAAAGSAQECCSLCAARADCWAATYVPGNCWFKTQAQTQVPVYDSQATGCWPAGRTPPPPSPPGCDSLPYETHGYYQHGEGYKTRNSGAALQPFDPNQPPTMPPPALTGAACPGTYASEFGAVAYSSWESMNPTLAPADWGLHNAAMSERNYAADNFITAFSNAQWPQAFDNVTGITSFQRQLYWQMLGQALWVKSDIEGRRAQNTWGTITWQFNEIWPTGGWGSIEYGTVGFTPGQVEGGRWKPLQYFMRRFLYRNHFIGASKDARVLLRSDDAFAAMPGATASLRVLHLADGRVSAGASWPVSLPRGAGATAWVCADGAGAAAATAGACTPWAALLPGLGCAPSGSDCIALLELRGGDGALLAENFELLAAPYALAFPAAATVTAAVAAAPAADGSVAVTLTASATALFVTLTTQAQGRFSDNALLLPPGDTVVAFLPWGPLNATLLASTLRVEHVALYGVNTTGVQA